MEQPFKIGDIVEILPCPLAEIFDIKSKGKVAIELISISNTVVKIKVKIGNSIFYLHPMELKKIKINNKGGQE